MTQAQWTVTQELHGALVILDEVEAFVEVEPALKLAMARGAIERALTAIQRMRCDAQASLDKL